MPHHSLKAQAMYRKFEFFKQPILDQGRPDVIHPDFVLKFSGVMEIDIEGNREPVELYIDDAPYYLRPASTDKTASADWRRFLGWLEAEISDIESCKDSDEAQAKIKLPPGNMYDEAYKKKPSGNARWFDPSELTAESAAEFAAIIGEVEQVGGDLLVTEFSHQKIN